MNDPLAKLQAMGLVLPPAPEPGGIYQPVVISGQMAYVSGHVPVLPDGSLIKGRVGETMKLPEAQIAARQVGLSMLSSLLAHIGNLNHIKRLVKTLGMVNCTPDFRAHPQVINGFSELMRELWGPENGVGARSAVGMMLPLGVAVEIEAIFELNP